MKRVLSFLLLAATALAVAGCLREQAPVHDSPRISIRAYIPEEPLSKASFSVPATGIGLHLAWQAKEAVNDVSVDKRDINKTTPAQIAAQHIEFIRSSDSYYKLSFADTCLLKYLTVSSASADSHYIIYICNALEYG